MLQPADGLFHALFPLEGRPAAGERSRLPGLLHAPQALSQRACRAPVAEEKVQQRTHDRYREDHKQPQDFIRRLVALDDDKQHQQHRRDGQRQRDVRRIRRQPLHQQQNPERLHRRGRNDGQHPPKHFRHEENSFPARRNPRRSYVDKFPVLMIHYTVKEQRCKPIRRKHHARSGQAHDRRGLHPAFKAKEYRQDHGQGSGGGLRHLPPDVLLSLSGHSGGH